MSETHHDALIKTPRQLIVVVIASFLIPVVGILLLIEYVDNTYRAGTGTDAMSPASIAQRIAPIAQLEIREAAATPALNTAATTPENACRLRKLPPQPRWLHCLQSPPHQLPAVAPIWRKPAKRSIHNFVLPVMALA